MYSLFFLAAVSFVLSLSLTPLVRNVFRRIGVVDHPGGRKLHQRAIPCVGGLAVAAAYLLSYGCLLLANFGAGAMVWHSLDLALRLAPAALVMLAIGLIDDVTGLNPWHKLGGQVLAAVIAFAAGIHIHGIAGRELGPWWSFPLTVLWLVGCANAVNLIDGVDGLAAGVGLFATCTTLVAALAQNNFALALATVPLAGCLLGFLRYNFNPATIFLGDCGSLFVGFLLGCYGVLWSQKAATILGMTAPLMALAIPLLDTGLAIARRFLRRQPIFGADRGHIHHRLLDRGLTPRKVALTLYACCALGAICSLLMMNRNTPGLVILLFCGIAWIGVQHLGYAEFGAAGRMFLDGAFRRLLTSQIALQSYEERLAAAPTAEECWRIVLNASRDLGFHRIRMILAGHAFEWEDGVCPMNSWDITIPIDEHHRIELTRSFAGGTQPNIIAPLAEVLRKSLAAKDFEFAAYSHAPAARMKAARAEQARYRAAAQAD